jgi:hypothetical protein
VVNQLLIAITARFTEKGGDNLPGIDTSIIVLRKMPALLVANQPVMDINFVIII